MATTAAGTEYTPHVWTNAVGDESVWAVADDLIDTDYPKPTLLVCHGSGGEFDQFTTRSYDQTLRDALIDSGWAYIEGDGGGPHHWGREFSMVSYVASCREAAGMHPLGSVVIMGRSMGGTVATSLAVKDEWGLKPHVAGLLLQAGVQSLYYWHVTMGKGLRERYPDAAEDMQAFLDSSEPFDPLRFDVELFEDMPVQFISGTHDASVPAVGNAQAQFARIRGVAPYADLFLRGLGTHSSAEVGYMPYFHKQWEFFRRAQGMFPEPVNLTLGGNPAAGSGTYYPRGWRQALPLTF